MKMVVVAPATGRNDQRPKSESSARHLPMAPGAIVVAVARKFTPECTGEFNFVAWK